MQCRQLEVIVDMIVEMVITVCTEVMSLTSTSCEYIKLGTTWRLGINDTTLTHMYVDLGTRLAKVFLSTVAISTPLVCTPQVFSCAWLLLQSPTSCSAVCKYVRLHIETHEYLWFHILCHSQDTSWKCSFHAGDQVGPHKYWMCSVDILPIITDLSHTCHDG